MKPDKKQFIELIGVIAVISSLAFVGMQLLLDRRVAVAEQYFNRAEAQRADQRSKLESETYFQVQEERWARGERPRWWDENTQLVSLMDQGKMSVRELSLDELGAFIGIIGLDNLYFQFNQGLLSEDDWNTYRQIMKFRMRGNIVDRLVFTTDTRPIAEVANELLTELENE